jgi:hypothetical protein
MNIRVETLAVAVTCLCIFLFICIGVIEGDVLALSAPFRNSNSNYSPWIAFYV